jgi:hypothetical protein
MILEMEQPVANQMNPAAIVRLGVLSLEVARAGEYR